MSLHNHQHQVSVDIHAASLKANLAILGVTEILCSFGLVLGGKMGKEIPES